MKVGERRKEDMVELVEEENEDKRGNEENEK